MKRDVVMRQIRRLAERRANDAVKLAFLGEQALDRLDQMDLSALTEFRRQGNGAVEIKLIDRISALQWLAEQTGEKTALLKDLCRDVERDQGETGEV